MNILVRKSCLSLILFSAFIEIIKANKNVSESNTDTRQGRVTGRIVKLYSGYKPSSVVCLEEGFKADPSDCSVFYRCVIASHRGNFNIFKYQCGPGTVYDPETEICNHPRNTKRSECGGLLSSNKNNEESEDNEVGHELPSPITTNLPSYFSQSNSNNTTVIMLTTVKSPQPDIFTKSTIKSPYQITTTAKYEAPASAYPWMSSNNEKYQISVPTVSPLLDKSNPCVSDGFIGDSENCRKFYRCVRNSYGSFTRHEFFCSDSTIWDDNIQSCNHAWAARNSRCGRKSEYSFEVNKPFNDVIYEHVNQQFNYGSKIPEKHNYNQNDLNKLNPVEHSSTVNYNRGPDSGNEIKDYNSPVVYQPPNDNYGTRKETSDTNEQYGNMQKQTTIASSTENLYQKVTLEQVGGVEKSIECSQTGFLGDPSDCSKFYRCVDSGNGKFMKYEFSCSPGTVWDSKVEACNHAWAVKECGGASPIHETPSKISTTTSDTSTSSSSSTTYKVTATTTDNDGFIDENNENGYFNPVKVQEETTKPTTVSLISSTTSATNSNNECKETGFFGDQNDCQIFYRCVDNGNGGFTRFEYKCGQGTLWDQDIEACNHAWAVKSCGTHSNVNITKTTKATDKVTTNSYIQVTTMSVIPSNNYYTEDNEEEETEELDKDIIDNLPKEPETNQNICQNVGFVGDTNDCKKFYRCVDNGNGGFTRHQFLCGEGTVWDSSIEACNHAWAVKSCGGNIGIQNSSHSENPNVIGTTQNYHPQSTISSSKTTSYEASSAYTTQSNNIQNTTSTPILTTMSTSTVASSNECSSDGFVGDKNDCKKFYRCVKNDVGGYERYDFYCGDGTLWDPKILACNHEWAVKECGDIASSESDNNVNEINGPTSPASPEEENENNYTSQSSIEGDNINSTTTVRSPTLTTSAALNETNKCQSSGFIGDENDCKKFYRCVENDEGMFTVYEFTCGEGTAWDSKITACNHEWAVETCYSNQNEQTKTTVQPPKTTQSTSTTLSTIDSSTTSPTQISHTSTHSTSTLSTTSTVSTTIIDSSSEVKQECDSEGFFPNKNNCKKFYRCVNDGKGGYTKYDFDCGEGTIWVQEIQACDHDTLGANCTSSIATSTESHKVTSSTSKPNANTTNETTTQHVTSTTDSPHVTSTTIVSTTDESRPSTEEAMQMKCQDDGYFGNTDDCKKFYRCVSDGKGGYTKYDYTCGEGTIWDNEIVACNHPQDVANPSCKSQHESSSEINSNSEHTTTERTTESLSSASTTTTESISTAKETEKPVMSTTTSSGTSSGSTTTSSSTHSTTNCTNNNTNENSDSQEFKCEKAGFYPDKYDCKKFHRCVDWDGSGNKFSVYHFECGDGTIWDPALETCNHESSVVPPRNCNGTQQASVTESTTTTEKVTSTTQSSTTEISSTESSSTEKSTTTIEQSTTQSSSTEQSTMQSSSTEQSTTQSSTSEQSTSQSSTSEQSTTQSSTSEQSTTQSSTSEQSTTQSSSSEQSTTQSSSTEQITTQQSVTSDTQATSTESTTTQSNQEQTNATEETVSTDSTTETTHLTSMSTDQTTTEQTSTSTEQSTTEDNMTQITEAQSTTSESTTTESSTESTSEQECPEIDSDQSLFVCPTSFKRHPKYCNLFYQCVEDNDSHEVKVTVFNCPNNTIYDETKVQCVEEANSEKKCNSKIAQKHRVKRLGSSFNEPISVSTTSMACASVGHFPFEKHEECSEALLKCELTKSGKLRGFVYKCPQGFVYWTVSRRCESMRKVRDCKRSSYPWNSRYDLPLEKDNIAS